MMLRQLIASFFLVFGFVDAASLEDYASDAAKWESEMERFDALTVADAELDDVILFVGSSSIRLWETMREDLALRPVVRRGFGGAKISDVAVYADRLIAPFDARGVVFFIGGNDVWGKEDDKTPKQIRFFANYLIERVRDHHGAIPITFIEITPSPARIHLGAEVAALNAALKSVCDDNERVHWLATAEHFLTDGNPNEALFAEDNLHLNRDGYDLWKQLISNHLESLFPQLRVGAAKLDITPEAGFRLCGSFKERIATGMHDPLETRALVFVQGERKLALVGCDVAMLYPGVTDPIRDQLAALGFAPGDVLLHASETHHGPDYFGEFRDVYHRRAIAAEGRDPHEPIDYGAYLVESVVRVVKMASEDLSHAMLEYGEARVPDTTFNRRFHMQDGSIGWNPGPLNPNIVKPAGPVDERLTSLRFTKEDRVIALAGFPLHLAIVSGLEYSADYAGQFRRRFDSASAFLHFAQAPCCELNHVDVTKVSNTSGHASAALVGETLYRSHGKIVGTRETAALDSVSRSIDLSLQSFPDEEIERNRERWHSENRSELPFLDQVHAGKVTGIYDRHNGGPIPVLLQAFQFSETTALIGLPSEISVEIGLAIQKASPYENTIVVQLSNDWFGYIPTKRIFEQGNYEATVAKIAPGEGERLTAEAVSLLRELSSERR